MKSGAKQVFVCGEERATRKGGAKKVTRLRNRRKEKWREKVRGEERKVPLDLTNVVFLVSQSV
jgi:hypothetical protein